MTIALIIAGIAAGWIAVALFVIACCLAAKGADADEARLICEARTRRATPTRRSHHEDRAEVAQG